MRRPRAAAAVLVLAASGVATAVSALTTRSWDELEALARMALLVATGVGCAVAVLLAVALWRGWRGSRGAALVAATLAAAAGGAALVDTLRRTDAGTAPAAHLLWPVLVTAAAVLALVVLLVPSLEAGPPEPG